MTTARDEIFSRIRASLADLPERSVDAYPVDWAYGQAREMDDVVTRFEDRVLDYKAGCERVDAAGLPAKVVEALASHDVTSVVLPAGLPSDIVDAVEASGIEVRLDEPQLTRPQLDATGAVVTLCAVAGAESGTIMMDHGPGQGRRALSLVPDVHVCVVRADQIVSDVPEAVGRIAASVRERRPITWISGGSATSDIELSRVEGVHGPRTLHVLIVE